MFVPTLSDIISTHIPTNKLELRKLYLVGEHAIVNNLPKPVGALVDGRQNVSLRYAISDFLGKGKLPAKIQYENKLHANKVVDSKLSREVYQRAEILNSGVSINDLSVI